MNIKRLNNELKKRQLENNLRDLIVYPNQGIDFFSNDYLGLSRNKKLLKIINKIPQKLGSTGSRLISGNTKKMVEIEQFLAQFYQTESSLFFQSGFMANVAFFSTIPSKKDTIIYDQNIHASTREGIRLSYAKSYSFKHNNFEDLEKKIKQAKGNVFVAIEGLYSMDGDIPNANNLISLVKKYSLFLVVDEAHAVGVLGQKGRGWSEDIPSTYIFAKVITFGKSMGYHGSIIAGNKVLIDYLINFAKPFIYTTAPSENTFIKTHQIHQFLETNFLSLSKKLHENCNYFNLKINNNKSISPIKIIRHKKLSELQNTIIENNLLVKAIRHPTVAKDKECLRVCIHNFNTHKEIDQLIEIIKNA